MQPHSTQDVTRILARLSAGHASAGDELSRLSMTNSGLSRPSISAAATPDTPSNRPPSSMRRSSNLVGTGAGRPRPGPLLALAARVMHEILVDHARTRQRDKRGGGQQRMTLDSTCFAETTPALDLVDLDDSLERLGSVDPSYSRIVELRFFAGLSEDEACEAMQVSRATAARAGAPPGLADPRTVARSDAMTPARLQQLEELFDRACRVPTAEHRASPPPSARMTELQRQLLALLAADGLMDAPLDAPLIGFGEAAAVLNDSLAPPPQRIGAYRILRLLGEGGMGLVYEAEQDNPRLARRTEASAAGARHTRRRAAPLRAQGAAPRPSPQPRHCPDLRGGQGRHRNERHGRAAAVPGDGAGRGRTRSRNSSSSTR